MNSNSGFPTLGVDLIGRIRTPCPPFREQLLIAQQLNLSEQQIERKEERLEKLKLLKQGLMTDLLTGRVRVNLNDSEDV